MLFFSRSFCFFFSIFFFNDTATTEIYTLSLHDALPISDLLPSRAASMKSWAGPVPIPRSEEHTSELQSRQYLVCRLLLEKKKTKKIQFCHHKRKEERISWPRADDRV